MEIFHEIEREGPVWYEWRAWRIHLPHDGVGEQWLLVQRQPDHPDDHRCYVSNTPPETSQGELAGAALTRHSIEELLAEAKSETGLSGAALVGLVSPHHLSATSPYLFEIDPA